MPPRKMEPAQAESTEQTKPETQPEQAVKPKSKKQPKVEESIHGNKVYNY